MLLRIARVVAVLGCVALSGVAAAAAPYYVRVAGKPMPINCGATTFFFGSGATMSWSFASGSQFTVDATAYINGALQGTQSFSFDQQTGSTGLEAINQASISYPGQSLPYALAVDIVPRDPYTDGVRIAFTCTTGGGTNFTATVIPAADASLQASPPALSFPATVVGETAAALTATITNTGSAAAPNVAMSVGASLDFAIASTTCGTAIAAGASCAVGVTFTPRAAGTRGATLTLTRDFGPGLAVALGGAGLAQLAMPAQVLLGSQPLGTSAAPRTLTVTNASASAVTVASVTSGNATEFPVTTTCASLAPAATCTIAVSFAPTALGPRNASITVVSDGVGSPQAIAVSGVGIAGGSVGELTVPATLAFGEQAIGTASAPKAVTITNTGSVAVAVAGIQSAAPAEFAVSGSTCATLQPGAQCSFNVAFAPAAAGARTAAISVTSNAPGSPQAITATGTGVAAAPPGQILATGSLAFGAQPLGSSAARSVTLSNTGGTTVAVAGVASSAPAEFAIGANTCASLAPAASCTFAVTFTPATAGLRQAVVTITSNGAGSPQALDASGTGVAPGQGQLAVDALVDAGTAVVGESAAPVAVTVVNVGTAVVQVASIVSANPTEFAIAASTCATVVPGATCAFTVVFTPSAAGARSASVTLVSDGGGSPQAVTVAGTGVPPIELVEYRHAAWDHYFVTGIDVEIRKLDNGEFAGWSRTGYRFRALPLGTAGAAVVCRFFSTSFGERSSHFYTPFADECAAVKRNPDWSLEGEVFSIAVPDIAGTCPANTRPVYRLYNQGQGGSPNHRYTTDLAVRAQMLAAGWIAEGRGDIGVIMCAPR